jgi:hypothetical protein
LFNCKLTIPEHVKIVQSLDTFNLVAFSALVMATRFPETREKIKAFVIGMIILMWGHFFFRLFQVFYFGYRLQFALRPFVGFIILNQWVLPFALWLAIFRKELFKRKGIYVCPFCGKQKIGILQHIKAKHGTVALKNRKIQLLLTEIEIDMTDHKDSKNFTIG